ncbi:DUF5345 family protein [Bacillus sp. 1P06AnD]|uniref:DUF5345 family protein n=1 Tax=Bacillus sp. 1P06AnD TaxID=3132208 RepID=UPI00399F7F93
MKETEERVARAMKEFDEKMDIHTPDSRTMLLMLDKKIDAHKAQMKKEFIYFILTACVIIFLLMVLLTQALAVFLFIQLAVFIGVLIYIFAGRAKSQKGEKIL